MRGIVRIAIGLSFALSLMAGCLPSSSGRPMAPAPVIYSPPVATPDFSLRPTAVVENPWQPDGPPREWRHIVIHHTASSNGSVESIHETHLGKGWQGIGYHFVIGNGNGMGDGSIEETFRWREQMHGAHAGKDEYNQHGIGICLVGNFEETDPSSAQLAAVKRLIGVLKTAYQIPTSNVIGHRDVKATACPGSNFPMDEVASTSYGTVLAELQSTSRPVRVVTNGVESVPVNRSHVR